MLPDDGRRERRLSFRADGGKKQLLPFLVYCVGGETGFPLPAAFTPQ